MTSRPPLPACSRAIIAAAILSLAAAPVHAAGPAPAMASPANEAVSLLDLYQKANGASPAVLAAKAGADAATYGVHDAVFGFLPRASFVYSPQREMQNVIHTDNPVYATGKRYFGNTGYTLEMVQPVIDPGAVARFAEARATQRGAAETLDATRQKFTFDMIEAYLLVLAALDDERLARNEEATYATHRDEVNQRVGRGMGNRTELADIDARIAKVRADGIAAHAGVGKALATLQRLTGRPVTALLPLRPDVPMVVPEPADPEAWVATSHELSPELKSLAASIDVIDAQFKASIATILPRLDLVLSDDRLNAGGSLYGGGALTDQQTAELRLTVPLFNADGRGYSSFALSEKRRQARYVRDDRQSEIDEKVRQAYLDAQRDVLGGPVLNAAVMNRQVVRDDIVHKFRAGISTTSDVVDSEREFVRSQRESLSAQYNYLISLMQLKRLTGSISDADVAYVDQLLDRNHAYVEQPMPTMPMPTMAGPTMAMPTMVVTRTGG
jgi:outer membrane protein TolC